MLDLFVIGGGTSRPSALGSSGIVEVLRICLPSCEGIDDDEAVGDGVDGGRYTTVLFCRLMSCGERSESKQAVRGVSLKRQRV